MYILDTDHLTILQRGGQLAQQLKYKLADLDPNQVFTTIITYEEQTRGWLSYIAKQSSIDSQIIAYQELEKHLNNYRSIPVIGYDQNSALKFQELRKIYKKLGSMDLKIASICITHQALLLTRNLKDFGQIEELNTEDWTI
ncbi:MAG: PIN domain-containing protein [Oscillatoriales cyanobacterium CG2_30_40_61]|nr:MAG: PIN domain-containing protein [Oscillatoriales cyanobacterium CG2_30_40_61]